MLDNNLEVEIVPFHDDNYAYLLTGQKGKRAVIDPGDAQAVLAALGHESLDYIINTHHHDDHIGGNKVLMKDKRAKLLGPAGYVDRIENVQVLLHHEDTYTFDQHCFEVITTPGHTIDHICLHFPQEKLLFTGDTLFSLGCGRLFEGTADQMFASLQLLKALPDDTNIYCGHEYTLANAEFALSVDPENEALKARVAEAEILRADGKPTLPVTMAIEKATNPFLLAETVEEFTDLRARMDVF